MPLKEISKDVLYLMVGKENLELDLGENVFWIHIIYNLHKGKSNKYQSKISRHENFRVFAIEFTKPKFVTPRN